MLTLGSDPEVHLRNNETGKIVSSIPILGRDKKNPILLPGRIKLYSDNVLAEVAHPPCHSSDEAVTTFKAIMHLVQRHIGPKYSIVPQAAAHYDADQLTDPKAIEVGCNPNFDAYKEAMNPQVQFDASGLRTGSFHIHIGHPRLVTLYDKGDFIKLMDIYVGCASVLFDQDPTGPTRRRYYGRAGEFRPTDYGCEYRVLGNYVMRSPSLIKLVFDLTTYTAEHLTFRTVKDILKIKGIQTRAQIAINENDKTVAWQVLDRAGLPYKLMTRCEKKHELKPLNEEWGIS